MRIVFVCIAAALLATGTTVAQSALLPVYCGDLPPADCDLLRGALARTPQIGAAVFDAAYSAYTYHGADGSVSLLFALEAAGTLRAHDGGLLAALDAFPPRVDASMTATVTIGDRLRELYPAVSMDATQLVLTGSTLYLKPADGGESSGWGRYHLADVRQRPEPPAEHAVEQQPFVTGLDPAALEAALGPEIARRYVTVTRSDHSGSAMFVTEVDVPGLYANPDFRALWAARAAERGIRSPDLDRMAAAAAAILPHTLKVIRYGVDPATGHLNHIDTWGMLDVTLMLEAALRGNDVTGWDMLTMTLDIDLRDIDAVPPIVPPPDSAPLSTEGVWRHAFISVLFPAQRIQTEH